MIRIEKQDKFIMIIENDIDSSTYDKLSAIINILEPVAVIDWEVRKGYKKINRNKIDTIQNLKTILIEAEKIGGEIIEMLVTTDIDYVLGEI